MILQIKLLWDWRTGYAYRLLFFCLSMFISACVPQMFYCKPGIDSSASQELSLSHEEILFAGYAINLDFFLFLRLSLN